MRSFVGARENARRFGLRMPDGFDEHLNRACDFALHCTRPDGGIPALSDADGGDYGALLALAADALDRDDLRYVATGGKDGTPPRERHASFPDGGYHVQRSGWAGPAERYMIFDCGPLGDGGHGHYDALSFELAAGGRPLIVDPGRYTYAEETPNLRRWFKSTAAHNTVCVDGLDQTPYRRGRPSAAVADARLRGRFTAPRLDVLCGEATSPAYSAVHRRTIAFVDDAYWVVLDRLHDELPRRYDARLHLGPDAQARTDVHRGEGQTTVRTPHLALCFAGDAEVALEDGWVAPLYGVRHEAPVVSASIEARSAALTTLVAPMERGQSSPHMSVECQDAWIVVNLNGLFADGHEVIALADTSAPLQLGPLHGRARAVWMRFSADGACVALSACEVSSLTLGDSFDVSADAAQPLASLAWEAGAGLSLGGRAS